MIQTLPKIMKQLNSRLTMLQKIVHNTSFLFLGALLMPIMSVVVLSDEEGFVTAYVGAWDDETE
jgi:predicted PurR-regulated permease PerM